jgi:hypothetical protein
MLLTMLAVEHRITVVGKCFVREFASFGAAHMSAFDPKLPFLKGGMLNRFRESRHVDPYLNLSSCGIGWKLAQQWRARLLKHPDRVQSAFGEDGARPFRDFE